MPEGPELRCSTDFLTSYLQNEKLVDVAFTIGCRYKNKMPAGVDKLVKELAERGPKEIVYAGCKGKFQWVELEKEIYLHLTHGMTGFWSQNAVNHTSFILRLESLKELYFIDVRHFGTMKVVHTKAEHKKKLKSIGHDMLSNPCTLNEFKLLLQKNSSKTLAEFLMNQKHISGVGNYVKAEALYKAQLSPHRKCGLLTPSEAECLFVAIKEVLTSSYQLQGASLRDYRTSTGGKGNAASFFKVYKKKNDELGNEIISEDTLDKRTTWWCPNIQV
jgi:formamidopyrimidine-DNA glycosylase